MKYFIWIISSIFLIGFIFFCILKYYFNFTITSWYRSPWKNENVGGLKTSWHLIGWAWDILPVNQDSINKITKLGLHYLNEENHIHIQLFKAST
jgi:hypothetical protein